MNELEKSARIGLINDFLKWMAAEFFPKWKPQSIPPGLLATWFEKLLPYARNRQLLERVAAELRYDMRKFTNPECADFMDKLWEVEKRDRPRPQRPGVEGDGTGYPYAESLRQQYGGNSATMHDYEVLIRFYRHLYVTQVRARADHMDPGPEREAWHERERGILVGHLFNHLCAAGMVEKLGPGSYGIDFAARAAEIIGLDKPQFEHDLRDVVAHAPVTKQSEPLHGSVRRVAAKVVEAESRAFAPMLLQGPQTPTQASLALGGAVLFDEKAALAGEDPAAKRRREKERLAALPEADRREVMRQAILRFDNEEVREGFRSAPDPLELDALRGRMIEVLDELLADVPHEEHPHEALPLETAAA